MNFLKLKYLKCQARVSDPGIVIVHTVKSLKPGVIGQNDERTFQQVGQALIFYRSVLGLPHSDPATCTARDTPPIPTPGEKPCQVI